MKELSLNILDIVENSVKAKASLTEILLAEKENLLCITVRDDGHGMPEEMVRSVTDPFCTTRTTRSVGLGIPLFLMAAEQTGGTLTIESKMANDQDPRHGTTLCATFYTDHMDFTPLGDIVSTLATLVQGHPDTDFYFLHTRDDQTLAELDTRAVREVLGDEIPLDTFEVIVWIRESLKEQYQSAQN